jgi:toxin YoeB
MRVAFTESGWNDYLWFQDHDRKLLKRINLLIKDTCRSPFDGIGKPDRSKETWQAIGRDELPTSTD